MSGEFDFEVSYYGKGIWRMQRVTLGRGPLGALLCDLLKVNPGESCSLQVTESNGAYEVRYHALFIDFLVAEVRSAVVDGGKVRAIDYKMANEIDVRTAQWVAV